MAIGFDAASNSGYEASLSTYNWSHTISGSNRILLLGVGIFASGTVTSATLGAQNFTFLRADAGGVYRSEIWYLIAPNTGTGTVTVNLSASLTSVGGAVSYTGVAQTSALEADNGANATGGTAAAGVTITTVADNDWVFAAVATSATSISTLQTERVNNGGALGTLGICDTGPVTPPAGTGMLWSGISVTDSWGMSGVGIKLPAVITYPQLERSHRGGFRYGGL